MKKLTGYIILTIFAMCLSLFMTESISTIFNVQGKAKTWQVFLLYSFFFLLMDIMINNAMTLKHFFDSFKEMNIILFIVIVLISVSVQLILVNLFETKALNQLVENIIEKKTTQTYDSNEAFDLVIFSVFFIPIVEELIFRGLVLRVLLKKVNKLKIKNTQLFSYFAIILVSALFALIHGKSSFSHLAR